MIYIYHLNVRTYHLEKCNKILLKSDLEINLESPVFLIQKNDYGCVMPHYHHVIRWFKDRRVKPRKWIIPFIIIHLRSKCCRCIPLFILHNLVAWRHISKANACTAICFFINHLQNVWQWNVFTEGSQRYLRGKNISHLTSIGMHH